MNLGQPQPTRLAQRQRARAGEAQSRRLGDGFGLGGSPGRWSTLYSQSPADFGLPAAVGVLGSDGTRGWVLSGQFLAQLLGSNWQQVIS